VSTPQATAVSGASATAAVPASTAAAATAAAASLPVDAASTSPADGAMPAPDHAASTAGIVPAAPLGAPQRPSGGQTGALPHDIRGLVPYEAQWRRLALPALLALIAVLVVTALALWWRRRRRRPAPVAPPEDPWDALLRRIRTLALKTPFERLAQEEFFFELSMLLREGIELRTGVRATDLTFQELRAPLRAKLPLATAEVERVLGFCERADQVKFAGTGSDRAEADAARSTVDGWVRQLRPAPAAPLPADGVRAPADRAEEPAL
jgi:hypothetical protein